jgi:hypothetical protein
MAKPDSCIEQATKTASCSGHNNCHLAALCEIHGRSFTGLGTGRNKVQARFAAQEDARMKISQNADGMAQQNPLHTETSQPLNCSELVTAR